MLTLALGAAGQGRHVVSASRAVNKETFHFLRLPSLPLMEPRQGGAGVGHAKREETQASLSANVRCLSCTLTSC